MMEISDLFNNGDPISIIYFENGTMGAVMSNDAVVLIEFFLTGDPVVHCGNVHFRYTIGHDLSLFQMLQHENGKGGLLLPILSWDRKWNITEQTRCAIHTVVLEDYSRMNIEGKMIHPCCGRTTCRD